MKATVELVYDDTARNRRVTVDLGRARMGPQVLDAVDRAVEKACVDDKDWTRWNLVDFSEDA